MIKTNLPLKVCHYNTVSTLSNWWLVQTIWFILSICATPPQGVGHSSPPPVFCCSHQYLIIYDLQLSLWNLFFHLFVEMSYSHCFSCLRYALWMLNFPKILFSLCVAKVHLLLILKNMFLLRSILLKLTFICRMILRFSI